MVTAMAKAGAQHQLIGILIDRYPDLVERLAEIAGVDLPEHDRKVPAPNSHQLRDGSTIETDTTIRLVRGGKTMHFAQVEMQQKYRLDKLTTLRAYHGSEVRNTQAGGHVFVISPKMSETRAFRAKEAEVGDELAFRVSYLSGADIAVLGADGHPFQDRALATSGADFSKGIPAGAAPMLREMQDHDALIADLFFQAIIQSGANPKEVEAQMFSEEDTRRFERIPTVKAWRKQLLADGKQEGREEGRAEGAVETRRAALLDYFDAKGVKLSRAALAKIRRCGDPEVLRDWFRRAVTGEPAAQLFSTKRRPPEIAA